MKLSRLGEFALIERIRRRTPIGRGVRLGIGDDAAWVEHPAGSSLITADLLIEDIHFNLQWTSLSDLGHKSLAVNLSDIAAMGGVPAYVVLSLGIPAHFDTKQIAQLYRGLSALAKKSRVHLVGGDTNVAKSLIISVCVIGHAPYTPVRRRGARPGDDIYVTGTLGDSALGLKYLRQKNISAKHGPLAQLLARHRRPTPRLAAGAALAREKLATAMIDVSDGLLQDLGHICKASGIGALIWNEQLPLSQAYRKLAGRDGTRYALSGGEDYELLFCARPRVRARIENLAKFAQAPITRVGTCVPPKKGIIVIDSAGRPIASGTKGHDHFRKN
jgi:thiamine-monophosphate kinase